MHHAIVLLVSNPSSYGQRTHQSVTILTIVVQLLFVGVYGTQNHVGLLEIMCPLC